MMMQTATKPIRRSRCPQLVLLAALICAVLSSKAPPAAAQGAEGARPPRISAIGFVTWWSHDATGYHPAIYLWLENTSGRDLSGQTLRFQGLFRDLRNGYVTVARQDVRCDFRPTQDLRVSLVAPTPFELPIDKFSWPSIESKVMCRVGTVGDEGTQDILITKVEQQTMTDDEALHQLIEGPHMVSKRHKDRSAQAPPAMPAMPAVPLSATALPLASALHAKPEHGRNAFVHYLNAPRIAGLGDDFYEFDQAFGKAADFDARDSKWTWVRYAHSDPAFNLYAGARGRTSKVDMIVVTMPASEVQQDAQLIAMARSLTGKFKNQQLSSPVKSVKYLPTGRIQLTTASAPSYKLFVTSPRGPSPDDNTYVLGISRVPGDFRAMLMDNAKRVAMLRFLIPLLADAEQD